MMVLERHGYRVLEAADGQQVLEVWQRHGPTIDLLLTDMVMPGELTGRDLARALRNEDAELKIILS